MNEKRRFFRYKNTGQIQASCGLQNVHVLNISSTGMLIKKEERLPKTGILNIKIHYSSLNVHYEILRQDEVSMALVFNIQDEIESLFKILKQLRDEKK
jgi:hypothetical protein